MIPGRGIYYVIEGPDGMGKSTQVDMLCEALRWKGQNPLRISEPDEDFEVGRLLRKLLKSGEHVQSHPAMFLATRLTALPAKVVPALQAGRPVVSDRSFISTLAYQSENWPLDWLYSLHAYLPAMPDTVVILDMAPEKAMERRDKRPDEPEYYEKLGTQRRIRERYLELARDQRLFNLLGWQNNSQVHIVDAEPSPQDVHSKVLWAVGL